MENSYRYFENRDWKYFPCQEGLKDFNCLFCYCPLYRFEKCLGNPSYFEKDGKRIKVCSDCTVPHRPENYERIIEFLKNNP